MNKAQIKVELRRSACKDYEPTWNIDAEVWLYVRDNFTNVGESIHSLSNDGCRIFFLLVAEAL